MLSIRETPVSTAAGILEGTDAAVQSYFDLAEGVYQLGRIDEAADLLARAFETAHEVGEEENPLVARVLNRLGVIRSRQGRHSEAERHLKRAVAILDRSAFADPQLATYLSNLGAVYRATGKNVHARATFERALRTAEARLGETDLAVAWTLDQIGDLETSEGDLPAAVFALQRALAIKEQVLGPRDWDVAVTLNKLGEVYLKNGRYNDAEQFLLRVVAIRERVLGWGDPALAKPLTRLGHLYRKQRKDGRAEQLVRYALKLFADVLPSDHPEIIGCLSLLSEIYRGLSRFADSDAVWRLAQGLVDGTQQPHKLARFVLPNPPRLSGPNAPAYQAGSAG
jgi:tetratricopeptide (TPR) repeat protein